MQPALHLPTNTLQGGSPDRHEYAHQICLISSVLFGGAMGYRAGSNPYVSALRRPLLPAGALVMH